jgi:DegV family protein with EDD domain
MPKTVIITDTDSSLPKEKAAEHGILQIPIGINFGDESFITDEDINDEKLFQMIDEQGRLPTTSAPNPQAYSDLFEKVFSQGAESIVCITVSSQVSSTFESAQKARDHFPDRDIHVIDSYNLSMGQGFMVLAASEAAARGANIEEIKSIVQQTGKNVHTYAILSTLKYLYMGGRISKLEASLADSFEIKPTLTVKDGKLAILEKNRTQKKAVKNLVNHIRKISQAKPIDRMVVIHVNEPDGASSLRSIIQDAVPCPQAIDLVELTPGLSVHTGKGLVGVVLKTK